jgi:hypothetical protein
MAGQPLVATPVFRQVYLYGLWETQPQGDHNMSDGTEPLRRQCLAEINVDSGSRESLEARCGQV